MIIKFIIKSITCLQISTALDVPRSLFGLSAGREWIHIFGGRTSGTIVNDVQKMSLRTGETVKLKPLLTKMDAVHSYIKWIEFILVLKYSIAHEFAFYTNNQKSGLLPGSRA